MYVVPRAQRAGHARRMLAHLEASAGEGGAEALVLETGKRRSRRRWRCTPPPVTSRSRASAITDRADQPLLRPPARSGQRLMLLPLKVAHGVADGSVTLAFRRWAKPDVKVRARSSARRPGSCGSTRWSSSTPMRSPTRTRSPRAAGRDPAAPPARQDRGRSADVPRRAGVRRPRPADRAARERRPQRRGGCGDRPAARAAGPAPAAMGRWTMATLELIGRRPHTRAPTWPAEMGRERDPFKIDVRKAEEPRADPEKLRRRVRRLAAPGRAYSGPDRAASLSVRRARCPASPSTSSALRAAGPV